jgi:hypothetical protein
MPMHTKKESKSMSKTKGANKKKPMKKTGMAMKKAKNY